MQARVRVLGEQEHRLLLRACREVAAVLLLEVVGAEVEAEVEARERELASSKRVQPTRVQPTTACTANTQRAQPAYTVNTQRARTGEIQGTLNFAVHNNQPYCM